MPTTLSGTPGQAETHATVLMMVRNARVQLAVLTHPHGAHFRVIGAQGNENPGGRFDHN